MQIIHYLQGLAGGDYCAVGVILLMLYALGGQLVHGQERLRGIGQKLGLAALIITAAVLIVKESRTDPWDLVSTALLAGIVGAAVTCLAWVALPIISFCYSAAIQPVIDAAERMDADADRAAREQRRRQEEHRRRLQQQADYERRAPERERQQREAEERAGAEAEARRRRDLVVDQIELFYQLNAAELAGRIKEEWVKDYIQRKMGTNVPADEIEERGRQLLATLQQALERANPAKIYRSVADINADFEQQRQLIIHSDFDEPTKKSLLLDLRKEQDKVVRRFIKRS